ncbi:MAG: hypothetical protein DWP94_02010 [Flavobacterium sp.]|nr:MAG: hypothetical protein DWP94_02010 [Flavobacterium sp.]
MGSFFKELKSRNVLKAALAYVIFSWVSIQAASILFSIFDVSKFWLQFFVIMLIIGLGIWLSISWHFEIGPSGIKRIHPAETARSKSFLRRFSLNYIILLLFISLIVSTSLFIYLKIEPDPGENIASGTITPELEGKKSIAVLAFLDLSPNRDNEYFSDGISEEILNHLSKNPELRIISRTSCFSFKNKDVDIRTIGKELNANYVLEGSVRRVDSNLRITVQLIRAYDGVHLWSETYQRQMADVFQVQDDIARNVMQNLNTSLFGKKIEETHPGAYTAFLQAKNLGLRYTEESANAGLKLIAQSLAIDSTYAPCWLLKSKLHFQIKVYTNEIEALNESLYAAEKAISLNPEYAEAHAWLGRLRVINSNFSDAFTYFEKALALNSESSEVLRNVSSYPAISLDDRIRLLQHAQTIDPLDSGNYRMLAIYYFFQNEFELALESMDNYLKYQPYGNGDHGLRGEILAWLGCKDEAMVEIENEEDEFSKAYSDIMASLVLELEGATAKVEDHKHLFEKDQPYLLAQMYAYMNEKDKAYELLDKALDVNDYDMYLQLKNDPYINHLKSETHYKNLLQQMKVPRTLELKLHIPN